MVNHQPQLFADTSLISQIDPLMKLGIFSGITTNPPIVAREAGNTPPSEYYRKLVAKYPNIPISIQLLDVDEEILLTQAREYASISSNIVIKVPMFKDGKGLSIASILHSDGINTNITGLMNAQQLTLAVLTGATYVSLFFNRIIDSGGDPIKEISNSRQFIDSINSQSKIIIGSIRKAEDVRQALVAGSHIVTVPPARVWEMIYHPKTVEFIDQSQKEWDKYILEIANDKAKGESHSKYIKNAPVI